MQNISLLHLKYLVFKNTLISEMERTSLVIDLDCNLANNKYIGGSVFSPTKLPILNFQDLSKDHILILNDLEKQKGTYLR